MSDHDQSIGEILDSWLESYLEASQHDRGSRDINSASFSLRLKRAATCAGLLRRAWQKPDETATEITVGLEPNRTSPGPIHDQEAAAAGAILRVPEARTFGCFRIRCELGRGGSGVVFLAFDPRVGRDLALKIPHPGVLMTSDLRARFLREARAAGSLNHPNVIPVYEVGNESAICYIACGYCAGPTLGAWLRQQPEPVPIRLAAAIIVVLSEAIQHAHNRGILHRDLKPSNVLLEPVTPPFPTGSIADASFPFQPKITDFGLALFMEEDVLATRTGTVLGTPSYMAPEQASSQRGHLGPATDVYALGAILYELLTGKRAFPQADFVTTVRSVQEDEPLPPRQLRPGVPRDLEAICLQCLRKDPRQRYDSAAELQRDLQCFLDGMPTRARRVGVIERLQRWTRRRPAAATLLLFLILLIVGIPVASLIYSRELRQLNEKLKHTLQVAELAQQRAEGSESNLREILYATDMKLAYQAWRDGDFRSLSRLLKRYDDPTNLRDLRGIDWRFLSSLQSAAVAERPLSTSPLYFAKFAEDGRELLVAGKQSVVWAVDAQDARVLWKLPTGQKEVNSVATSHDQKTLATAGDDGTVRLWDRQSREPILTIPAVQSGQAFQVSFSPDGQILAVCGYANHASLWNPANGSHLADLTGHTREIEALAFSPDGKILATASSDYSAKLWSVPERKLLRTIVEPYRLTSVKFSADGKYIVLGCMVGTLSVVDVATGETVSRARHLDGIQGAAFLRDEMLVAVDRSGTARMWRWRDVASGETLQAAEAMKGWAAHEGRGYAIDVAPNCQSIATVGDDGALRIWRVAAATSQSPRGLFGIGRYPPASDCVVIPGDEHRVMTAHQDAVRIWSVENGTVSETIELAGVAWKNLALTNDGRLLAAGDGHGQIHIWDYPARTRLRTIDSGLGETLSWLSWSANGRRLNAGGATSDDGIRILDPISGKRLELLRNRQCKMAAFSPQGDLLAVETANRIELWDVDGRALVSTLGGHQNSIQHMAFSPEGRWLASCGSDRHVMVWDVANGTLRHDLVAHRDNVLWTQFSQDGQTLLSAGLDGGICFWHLPSGQLSLRLPTPPHSIYQVAVGIREDWCCIWHSHDVFALHRLR